MCKFCGTTSELAVDHNWQADKAMAEAIEAAEVLRQKLSVARDAVLHDTRYGLYTDEERRTLLSVLDTQVAMIK